jgi:hypothetical protein
MLVEFIKNIIYINQGYFLYEKGILINFKFKLRLTMRNIKLFKSCKNLHKKMYSNQFNLNETSKPY